MHRSPFHTNKLYYELFLETARLLLGTKGSNGFCKPGRFDTQRAHHLHILVDLLYLPAVFYRLEDFHGQAAGVTLMLFFLQARCVPLRTIAVPVGANLMKQWRCVVAALFQQFQLRRPDW